MVINQPNVFFCLFFQDQPLILTTNGDVLWEMEYPKAYADVFGSGGHSHGLRKGHESRPENCSSNHGRNNR